MPLSAIAEVLVAVDDPAQPVHEVLGAAAERNTPGEPGEANAESAEAREEVEALLARRGWRAGADSPAGRTLAGVMDALRRAGHGGVIELLDVYADAAERVAHADLDYVKRRVAREELVESVVVGTVLGEAMLGALRRLAHAYAAARAYEGGRGTGQGPRE